MIHIVFQESDVAVLQEAISLDESLQGQILQIKDDYAVGPITDIFTEEGINRRKEWWRTVLAGSDLEGKVDDGSVDDLATVTSIKSLLDDDAYEQVWIWAAQNKHDVCGYYWLISQLKDYQGRVYILYLNNLPFFNDKGSIFYPDKLQTIPPREFLKAKKLARLVTLSEFEVDPDEWNRLCEMNMDVRILEGGKKLVQHDVDFYDVELRKFVTSDWQKAARVVNQFLQKSKHTTGDAFVLWRLKQLVQDEEIVAQGIMKGMKDFEVKTI